MCVVDGENTGSRRGVQWNMISRGELDVPQGKPWCGSIGSVFVEDLRSQNISEIDCILQKTLNHRIINSRSYQLIR